MSRSYINHILSAKSITVIFNSGLPMAFNAEHPFYGKLRKLIENDEFDRIPESASHAERIKLHANGMFYVRDGVVLFSDSDEELPTGLSKRLIAFADADIDIQPLIRFWENLKKNPSNDSRQDLFDFLEANNIPLTEDGYFLAYKRVKDDWFDCYTGKIENKPGAKPRMDRDLVDPNRNHTCSTGLHVAAFSYAKSKYYTTGRLLKVKVNPRDVVAVPPDYNQEKMRVCEYEVLGEIEREYTAGPLYQEELESVDGLGSHPDDYDYDIYDEDDLENYNDTYGIDSTPLQTDVVQKGGKVKLTAGKDKRYVIRKQLTDKLGVGEGDTLAVFDVGGKCVIAPTVDGNAKIIKTYSVDNHGNIRVSNQTLKRVGLGDRANLNAWVEEVDTELQIVLSD